MLRDGIGRVRRDARHHKPQLLCARQIHVVETSRAKRDQPHARLSERVKRGGVHMVIHKRADRAAPRGQRHRLVIQVRLQEDQLMAEARVDGLKRRAVVPFRAEKRHFHGSILKPAVRTVQK